MISRPIPSDLDGAVNDGERADILLRMPLHMIALWRDKLIEQCRISGLQAGVDYVILVAQAIESWRNPDGSLAGDLADRVTTAGAPLVELARAARPVGDDEGICRRAVVAGFPTILPETADGHDEPPNPNPACVCPPHRPTREACPAWRWK